MIDTRQRQIFQVLWSQGRLSRLELHKRTGFTPNGVGALAETMLRAGLLRECPARARGAGRPRVPLEVDPTRRHVIISEQTYQAVRARVTSRSLGSVPVRGKLEPVEIYDLVDVNPSEGDA